MLTMFRVLTNDDWAALLENLAEGFCGERGSALCKAQPILFFLSFVLLVSIILINMLPTGASPQSPASRLLLRLLSLASVTHRYSPTSVSSRVQEAAKIGRRGRMRSHPTSPPPSPRCKD